MNNCNFTGNLGKDCRIGMAGQTKVCNFNLAVKSGYGERETTIWLECSLWGKRADGKLPDYLVRGAQVAVTGELGQREHEGKMYLTLRVADLDLIGGKSEKPQGQALPNPFADNPDHIPLDDDIPF